MRRLAFSCLMVIAVAGCGRSGGEENVAAADANMMDENTINALLGADIPPEDYPGASEAAENQLNADANSDEADGGNQADGAEEER